MASKKRSKVEATPTKYLTFLEGLVLEGIGLDSSSCSIDRVEYAAADQAANISQLTLDANFEILLNDPEALVVGANFSLKQSRTNDTEKNLLDIACSFSALFKVSNVVSDADASRFANTEAKLVFWPYLRHFVADTSYRMSINPILVPIMTSGKAGATTSENK
jgi:preprotein translocase subunit SecB